MQLSKHNSILIAATAGCLMMAGCASQNLKSLPPITHPQSIQWQKPVAVSEPTSPETAPRQIAVNEPAQLATGSTAAPTESNNQFSGLGSSFVGLTDSTQRVQTSLQSASEAVIRGQSPGGAFQDGSNVRPVGYQSPELNSTPAPGSIFNPVPNGSAPFVKPDALSGIGSFPQNYANLDVYVTETMTGRINLGGAYNSDNGLVGQFVVDERNFDIARFPRSFREVVDGTAWRGAGQGFRLELVPGSQVQRYLVSFTEPYLFDTAVSLSVSGFLFTRNYFDWNEQRLGGRVALGYRLTPDISVSAGLRMENVDLSNPRVNTSPELNASLGSTDLFMAQFGLINDTRDHPFLPTEGMYLAATYSQAFGEVAFPRGDLEMRRYRLMYQRPDGSGRHTISFGTKLGFSGSDTPIFENYFAGGFSTMRGFKFRGASPLEGGVRVGGEFQWLNTLEYMFPLTADDMIKAVAFCDFGTIEREIDITASNFRVAPGFGLRVHMPAAGLGAPLAFDFAFPVSNAAGDEKQVFSFYMGMIR